MRMCVLFNLDPALRIQTSVRRNSPECGILALPIISLKTHFHKFLPKTVIASSGQYLQWEYKIKFSSVS